jgi:hypothetical protein
MITWNLLPVDAEAVGLSWPQQPRSAVAPAPRAGVPAAARRPAAVGHPNGQAFIQLPLRQAGNDASRRMERPSMDQTTHNAESERVWTGDLLAS